MTEKALATTMKARVKHVSGCMCGVPCHHCGHVARDDHWECASCKTLVGRCAVTALEGHCCWCVLEAARKLEEA